MNTHRKKLLPGFLIILASVYLTFIVDVYTLNTVLKRVFVFCYFAAVCVVLAYLKQRHIKKATWNIRIVAAVIVSGIILAPFQSVFLPAEQEIDIYLRAGNGEDGTQSGEAWLTEVELDGVLVNLSRMDVLGVQGWQYNLDYDDYVFYPLEEPEDNYLILHTIAEEVSFRFATNTWSGTVYVETASGESQEIALYSTDPVQDSCEYTISNRHVYTIVERVVYNLGALTILGFLALLLIDLSYDKARGLCRTCFVQLKKEPKHFLLLLILWSCLIIVMLGVLNPRLIYRSEDYTVTFVSLADPNEDRQGYEIQFLVSGPVEILESDSEWREVGDQLYLCQVRNKTLTLLFDKANDNSITLLKNVYSAAMEVNWLDKTEKVDLFSPVSEQTPLLLNIPRQLKSPVVLAATAIGLWILSFSALCLCKWLMKKPILSGIALSGAVFSVCCLVRGETAYCLYSCAGVICAAIICGVDSEKASYIFRKKWCNAFLLLAAAYITFALWGRDMFLKGVLVEITAINAVIFVHLWLLTITIIYACLFLFEYVVHRNAKRIYPDRGQIRIFRVTSFVILAAIFIIECAGMAPANFTSDGVDQWIQALGYIPIYNYHPAIHTIFLRICSWIYPSPLSVTIAHGLLLSYIMSSILALFYKKGGRVVPLLLFGALIAVLPNTVAMITLISKNTLFAILMLWMVYLAFMMFEDVKVFFERPQMVLQLISVLAAAHMVRYNAFTVLPVVFGMLVYFSVRYWKMLKLKPMLCMAATIALIWTIQGPVYDSFQVVRSKSDANAPLSPLTTPFVVALKCDIPLPEDTLEYLEKILPLDEYAKRYNPYRNILYFSEPQPNYSAVTVTEAFQHYMRLLTDRPDIAIKDRLDQTNLLWDVFKHSGVPNDKYALGIWGNLALKEYIALEPQTFIPERQKSEVNYGVGNSILTTALVYYIAYAAKTSFLDSIFWRNGLYVVMMLVIAVLSLYKRDYKVIAMLMIPFGVLCTLLLAISYQIYQYYWFFPLCIIAIGGYLYYDQLKRPDETADHSNGKLDRS